MLPVPAAAKGRPVFTLALFSLTVAASMWLMPVAPLARQNVTLIKLLKLYERGVPEKKLNPEPKTSSEGPAFNAKVSWLKGLIALRANGDQAAALIAWRQAAAENARRLSLVGRAAWNQGQRPRGVEYARLAVAVDPTSAETVATLTAWLVDLSELNQAAADLDEVLSGAPGNAAALACRGYVAFRQGSAEDARRYLERATVAAPDDRTVIGYQARFLIESRGPEDQLETIMRRGDRLYGDFHYDLAKLYIAQKRYAEAAPYVTKLLAERPQDAYAREIVGGYYFLLKRYREALAQYETASRMVPTEPRFFINVGQAHAALDNRAAAVDAYCAAMKLDTTGNARALLHAVGAGCGNAQ